MTQKKGLIIIIFNTDQVFLEFPNLSGSSIYELPDNRLQIETLTYTPSIDSITQSDSLLIQLSVLLKTSSKDLSRLS